MFTRWPISDVQNEMQRIQDEINRLFGRDNRRTFATSADFPALNLWENGDGFVVEAELPGIEMEDIEIYVDGGNQLTVKGQRKASIDQSGTWHRRERGHGQFKRSIALPSEVDSEKVEAVLKSGVLTITLPKPEQIKPKKISVKAH